MIKVLVADDHDIVRTGIVKLLEAEDGIKVIAEASSGEEAVQLSREKQPDVVLMDLRMPGMGGVEATRKIVRANPDIKVIAVTAYGEEPLPLKIMQAGAVGYVTKGASSDQMVRAIRNVSIGQRYISADLAQQLANSKMRDGGAASPFENLSDREMQICLMIVSGEKVQEISDQLCLSTKTVNTYRYRLFSKLNVQNDVGLTLLALRHGLIEAEAN